MVFAKTFFTHIVRLALLAGCCFLAVSCRYRELREPAPFVHELAPGEKFRITLPEDHRKMENWSMEGTHDDRVLQMLNEAWHGNDKGIDFNFLCRSAGSATLVFTKRKYSDTLEKVKYNLKITDN